MLRILIVGALVVAGLAAAPGVAAAPDDPQCVMDCDWKERLVWEAVDEVTGLLEPQPCTCDPEPTPW